MSAVLETRDPAFAHASNVPLSLAITLPRLRAVAAPVLRRTIFNTPDSRIAVVASPARGCRVNVGCTARVRPRPASSSGWNSHLAQLDRTEPTRIHAGEINEGPSSVPGPSCSMLLCLSLRRVSVLSGLVPERAVVL